MGILSDHAWKSKYTPEDGDLLETFYLPALEAAVRYDRTSGYFSASALALAARGIEGLILNNGRMRLIVGCTLGEAEAQAVQRGESLKETAEALLLSRPLVADSQDIASALELLAWMVARGYLEVKVAIALQPDGNPAAGTAIFHEKAGIIEDKTGDRVAFSGSINETAGGWKHNWESFHLYCSWEGEGRHIEAEEQSFRALWQGETKRARVFGLPEALAAELLRFAPPEGEEPARLTAYQQRKPRPAPKVAEPDATLPLLPEERRRQVWGFIQSAAARPDGIRVGEATSAVTAWPHQLRAFVRMYRQWPPRLLIADEVGLGKTVQAGLLIRQAWLAGKAKRILILAPRAVIAQWQLEMREKFNLNIPVYDGKALRWLDTPGRSDPLEREVTRDQWHQEPLVLASSHLMRRRDRRAELLEQAEPWDLVILDEAHHARRKAPGQPSEGGPNLLLALMQALRERTQGLVLLTATPMQVHPVEVWDLLSLFELPAGWDRDSFLRFFEMIEGGNPSHEQFDELAALFHACEARFGEVTAEQVVACLPDSRIKRKRILAALRDHASVPRRGLKPQERQAALKLIKDHAPVARLISRHTRDLLRHYRSQGKLSMMVADRLVEDRFFPMTSAEAALYEAVEEYIATTYNNAAQEEKSAVGFVMTIYRRRLASSFYALQCTLEGRLRKLRDGGEQQALALAEDLDDPLGMGEEPDLDDAETLEREALQAEEEGTIQQLLRQIRALPADTKAQQLSEELAALRQAGYPKTLIFTQFTDTVRFLRDRLADAGWTVCCYSGKGGEVRQPDGQWSTVTREAIKRRFRKLEQGLLLCTDAAAEGLNFQYCGALINYDLPWNPMRVEQRIGRIDRLGQAFPRIAIRNLGYQDTVETDVYHVLRTRIGLFGQVVGKLQPILARLPRQIEESLIHRVASPDPEDRPSRRLVATITSEIETAKQEAFDLDASQAHSLEAPDLPPPPIDLRQLALLLEHPDLLPADYQVERRSDREYYVTRAGQTKFRVTTNAEFFDEHGDSAELWSPGGAGFPSSRVEYEPEFHENNTLNTILDQMQII